MEKKVLIIINPRSGTMKANKYLTEIVEIFVGEGYMPIALTTMKRGDGTEYAKKYAKDVDLVICIGGDGTFNEVAAGLVESGVRVPIGYIPGGSTNDFASSLGLAKDVIRNAKNIVEGTIHPIDLGSFNGRTFSYIASFGAFTKASYATSQTLKNTLGHMAYILEGAKDLTALNPIHMAIEADGQMFEGDYLLGAISNSTSVGGILTLKKEYVDLSDGMFELLLIKAPKTPLDLAEILLMLRTQDFKSGSMVQFINAKEFRIKADESVSWTLDGEYQAGSEEIHIKNLHGAIDFIMRPKEMIVIDSAWKGREIRYE